MVGSEQGGIRPVLIVQNEIGNRHSPTVIAAAITSRLDKTDVYKRQALHWHESMELVFVKQGMGLVQVGVVTYPAYRGDIFLFAPRCV